MAWNAIVLFRHMMLALDKRLEEDSRSFGELFFDTCDEMQDMEETRWPPSTNSLEV
jgi:hypothetical protein